MPPPPPANRPARPPRLPRWLGWVGILTLMLGAGVLVSRLPRGPQLPVPHPSNPAGLDPQVREYVGQLAAGVEADPRNPSKRATLGLAYAANELWAEARQAFLDTARLDPRQPLAPLYAAVAREEIGDAAGALPEYQRLTELYPDFAPGWFRLGDAALRSGDLTVAEGAFTQLVRLAPTEWRGPAGLGEIRLRQGRAPEAIPLLEQARRLDPAARGGVYLLGQAYRAVGRTNDAQLTVSLVGAEARQPMPDPWAEQASLHMRRLPDQLAQAEELARQGRADLAVPLLQQARRFHPDHAGLTLQLAVALNRSGQPAQALPLLDSLQRTNANAVAMRIARSHALAQLEQLDAALAEAREAVALDPKLAQAHLAVANAQLAREDDLGAVESLRTAITCDPRNGEIHVEIGTILWRNLANPDAAQGHFLQAIELSPTLPRAYSQLGLLQVDRGQLDAARETLNRLRTISPAGPETTELTAAIRQ